MDNLDRGRIVWLTNVFDKRDRPTKDHRAVIITTKADHEAGKPIQAVYISSKFDQTPDERKVLLKWARSGHPHTGLNRPSAVICDWRNKDVRKDDITTIENRLYGATLIEIMTKVAALEESTQ